MPFLTVLTPAKEREFQAWTHAIGEPAQDNVDARGRWLALRAGDPRAQDPAAWQLPSHPMFSSASVHAGPDAPSWSGDVLLSPDGRIVADQRPEAMLEPMLTPSAVRAKRIPLPPIPTVNDYVGPQIPQMPGPQGYYFPGNAQGGGESSDSGGQ